MSYEILRTAEKLSILHITATDLDSLSGWQIEFDDGKDAVLYYHSGEWVQYNEHWLDGNTLLAIGNCIDISLVKNSLGKRQHYFNNLY